MNPHTILAFIAATVAIVSFFPYMRNVTNGKTKPHIFTWISWALTTTIYLFIQLSGGAGIGALTTGITLLVCLYIIAAAFRQSERSIKPLDWVSFVVSLTALTAWYFSNNAVYAVVLIIISDFTAILPTIRKSYEKPYSETLSMYFIGIFKQILVISSLEQISFITAGFNCYVIISNIFFTTMVVMRRKTKKIS